MDFGLIVTDFVLTIAKLLVEPAAPGLAVLALMGTFVALSFFYAVSVWRQRRALKLFYLAAKSHRVGTSFPGDTVAVDEDLAPLSRSEPGRRVKELWSSFRQTTLRDQNDADAVLLATVRPSMFWNVDDLRMDHGSWRVVPSVFVSVGLFLTFLGLVAALTQTENLLGSAGDAQEGLKKLLSTASAKFIMSLTGLACSILFGLILRIGQKVITAEINRICSLFEGCIPLVSLEAIAHQQLLVSHEQRDATSIALAPLALDSPIITIRKFPQDSFNLMALVGKGAMSAPMARYLKIAAICRLNMVISGGTGSGKTTLLNAISKEASNDERIVTIEDTAELRLQQRHVVRLETRPPSVDGTGEVTMRQLLKNALRMRPDRIIIGEVRGSEVVDFLQAMNTGHDGSLSTIHANSPREAVSRLANLVALSGVTIPIDMLLSQLRDAIHVIVQVERMNDGARRVSSIAEIVGNESGTLTMQEMFTYVHPTKSAGSTVGSGFRTMGVSSAFLDRAARYGVEAELRSVMSA